MRIIAGKFRGRPLRAPEGMSTRPTSDRARQAIFNILGPLDGLNVLDCFAGTGAMGIESMSRGAARATFIEADVKAMRVIRANLEKLGLEKETTLVEMALERSASRLDRLKPFDLVMSDPPWAMAQQGALAVAELVKGRLAEGGRVLLGHPTESPVEVPESTGLTLVDRRKWGGSGMSFYEKVPAIE